MYSYFLNLFEFIGFLKEHEGVHINASELVPFIRGWLLPRSLGPQLVRLSFYLIK